MKAEFINILNDLKMNSVLMKEIDLETLLTLLKNFGVITDCEADILRSKGPIGGRYELIGTILPNKVDEQMELFIKSLQIAGSTQLYEFVLTRVNNVGASGAGVVVVPRAGVARRGVAPVNVRSSNNRMKGENPLMEEAHNEMACVEMATSSVSVKQCDVSYLNVYQNWIQNDRDRNNGQSTIPINEIARKLKLSLLLKIPEYQIVNRQEIDEDKLVELFYDFMPGKGEEGFNQVVICLKDNNYIDLARDLTAQMQKGLSIHVQMEIQNPLMVEAQNHLSKFINLNVDSMADFWLSRLHLPSTWSAFVDVQILEDFQDDRGKVVPSGDYVQVFENVSKTNYTRILIQGDPGCGKSTYVNKVAIDWAKKHGYLREKFDLMFLISLQMLEVGIEQAIRNLLPQSMIEFVEDYYKSHLSKVLLILDGFDELPEYSPFYTEVINMLDGDPSMSQYSFFTTIVTTRRSHVDKVPKRFHARSLLIKGFDEQSMKLFLQTQNVPVPDEEADPNLVVLLQNPFFCAIYCSLHFFGVDKSKLEDPYDFIKALVENAVQIEKETKGITNDEDQLQLLGAFAFQTLNSEKLNVVETLFPMSFLFKMTNIFKKKPKHVQRIDTDKIQLGLLIKKKIPADGTPYKEEVGFRHQFIAEYLAARYFIRSTTKSQLKQLQPEKLAQGELSVKLSQLILSSPSSLTFVRFLLFEYLDSHLHDARNGRELIFRFLTDEFRFTCYCKSKSETSKINDITSLVCWNIDSDILHDSRFYPTLAKCNQLKSLDFSFCKLSRSEAIELVALFKENHLPKLRRLHLSDNSNVCSTPDLFAALGNCKQLERLDLQMCDISMESINQLTTCIEDKCWMKLSQLVLSGNSNIGSTPALFAALGKCKQLERLDLQVCDLSTESINRLTTCIDDNCWVKLSQLVLSRNSNVGSTPALFTALGNCEQLERLDLKWCSLSIESINRLTTCFDNYSWTNLTILKLSGNENVGSAIELFRVLHKCLHLGFLDLSDCSLTNQSMKIFLSTFNSNTFQDLEVFDLSANYKLEIDDNFYLSLLSCSNLSHFGSPGGRSECELNTSGQKAKKALLDLGCKID